MTLTTLASFIPPSFDFHKSDAQRMIAVHVTGYCIRQNLYNGILTPDNFIKETTNIMQMNQHTDFISLTTIPLLFYLALRDSSLRKSTHKLKTRILTKQLYYYIEVVVLCLFFVLTKDVENAI
jgi:predicted ferric reductase